jgi:hypothetical protein
MRRRTSNENKLFFGRVAGPVSAGDAAWRNHFRAKNPGRCSRRTGRSDCHQAPQAGERHKALREAGLTIVFNQGFRKDLLCGLSF